jgi:CDGSH-type Zn-finger protein
MHTETPNVQTRNRSKTCGKSKSQPFCDGSHKGSEFTPVKYIAEESKTVYFCGCKHSANGALCDGSHKSL